MNEQDALLRRAQNRFAKQEYDKQVQASGGSGAGQGYEECGPPFWSRDAWDRFHAQFGRWPFSASELPPSFEGCPDWAYQRMNLRPAPVQVSNGAQFWNG